MPWEKQFDIDQTLATAMAAFWAHGYEATSMQDLVECTAVNRASLYATYGDKRALFLAALRHYDTRVRQAMLADLENRFSPREAIRQLFLAFARQPVVEGVRRGCLMTNTALELAAHDAEVAQIVASGQAGIEAFFRRMIENGKAAGEVRSGIDPVATARGLLAGLLGLVVLVRSRPDPDLLESIAEEAVRQLD